MLENKTYFILNSIKMCTNIDMADLITVHHEQGKILKLFFRLQKALTNQRLAICKSNKATSNTTNNTKTNPLRSGMEQIQVKKKPPQILNM
jgi:hypothetical protein